MTLALGPQGFSLFQGGGGQLAIRPVLTRMAQTFVNTHGSDGVNTQGKYVSIHEVQKGGLHGQFQIFYANRCSEAAGFNTITVSADYCYPIGVSAWIPFTFGGAASKTLLATDVDAPVDAVELNVPEGSKIGIRSYVRVASAGMKWPTIDNISLSAANGEGALLSTTDISGSNVPPSDATEFYGPVASRGLSTATRAIAAITDSIGNSAKDDPTRDRLAFIERVLGPSYPVMKLGTSGEQASEWVAANAKRWALLLACGITDVVVAIGTNDYGIGGQGYTAIRNSLLAIFAKVVGAGFGLTVCPILARGNVSVNPDAGSAPGGVLDQVNTFLASDFGLKSKFWDTRVGWQNASNQILSASYTDDWLHPNAVGHAAIAAASPPASTLIAATANPALPAPPFWSAATFLTAETLRGVVADGAAVGSWTDTQNRITATEATNKPTFKANATPNGKASVDFPTGGTNKLTLPAGGNADDIFASDGLLLCVFKPRSAGGGSLGKLLIDATGFEALGITGALQIGATLDFATTDASRNAGITNPGYGAWSVAVEKYTSPAVPALAVNTFAFTNMTTPAGAKTSNAGGVKTIGNTQTGSRQWDGEIAAFAWFKGQALTDDQIAAAQAYIRAYTGVAVI